MQENDQKKQDHVSIIQPKPSAITVTEANQQRTSNIQLVKSRQQQATLVPVTVGRSVPTLSFSLPNTTAAASSVNTATTRFVSPQTLNLIQRQLGSGIVGLSAVSAQGLQLLQASGTPLTFVTTTSPKTTATLDQRNTLLLLQQAQKRQSTGGSIVRHLAPTSPANPNKKPSIPLSMSEAQQVIKRSQPAVITVSQSASVSALDLKLATMSQQSPAAAVRPASSFMVGGPSPKKIKLEAKPAKSKYVENYRRSVCAYKRNRMREIKRRYRNHLTELFYLQGGGNMTEFNLWKKRPSQPLLEFLASSKLDSDDEDAAQDKSLNDEMKILTSEESGTSTPVSTSTTLLSSTSVNQQALNSSTVTTSSLINSPSVTASSQLQQHLAKTPDLKPTVKNSTSISTKSIKSNASPSKARQHSISSVYENVTGGSQDVIVERAKQEAQVIQRVNELRKEGLWSAKRLPRVQEPPRQKAHWDYLLEEMTWLAADFIQERKWKKAAAKKLARMVNNHFKEQEQKELKAEKEEGIKLKKIASQMAKMVKEFWVNIEKVVQYKQTTRMEEKKKKALDLHLSFIVDQTEKYSSWLTAGLQATDGSHASSIASDADGSVDSGEEFMPTGTASDDEETIEKEENEMDLDEAAAKEELDALHKESELPIEELLKTLPQEMLENPTKDLHLDGIDGEDPLMGSSDKSKGNDDDFSGNSDDESEAEETIEEQEEHEKKDYTEELDDLKAEGEMSVEELMKKYSGAYESDFQMPEEESSAGGSDDQDEESSESEKESESEEEEEEEAEEEKETAEGKKVDEYGNDVDMGLEFLVKKEKEKEDKVEELSTEGPGKEFNDIAAAAESLQPKGYTLETTEVKTKVPFLLKHSLREYQHVGLDWLATMHEKRLNGILADEMGLGKTIQTIAMLAHLACEKGVWGPHLIVVPTSVMLNWEMELKKWCPAFKILTYYGSIKERKLKRQGWTKTNAFHVCITSYKLVVQDHQAFRRKKWKYFILDEAQNIKNFKSQRWQMLLNFSSQRRLLLTGTPLQNSLMELWSLMHFLMPNVFQSHSEFKEWFSNPLTGMIEGSQEYNESLVRRLHKVLRPFLLRRLKNEVEKQMPQKFEHVVMCRLSKRQRYLYDDFMSQAKTKDTLSSGHFMSVINILMQLRKVCNHPNLFDPRPIVSPFKMEGIVYHTASLATKVLEYDPLKDIDIYSLYPNLAEMETDLPAFVAQRVKQLKAPGKLIEEVDSLPEPAPRPKPGVLKNLRGFPAPPAPLATKTAASPSQSTKSTTSTVQSTPTSVNSIKLLLPPSSSTTQQTILISNPNGSGPPLLLPLSSISSTSATTSAAIAQAKLISSQLQRSTTATSVTNTTPSVKPVPKLPMKRSELFMESLYRKKEERRQHILALMSRLNNSRCDICPVWGSDTRWCVNCLRGLESVSTSLPTSSRVTAANKVCNSATENWRSGGYLNCLVAQQRDINVNHPDIFWRETSHLRQAVNSPEDWLEQLKDILSRFVFVTPTVISPSITMRAFHPNQSEMSRHAWLESTLRPVVVQGSASLHPIQSRTMVTFPELRLIQYDCGKLQTMDRLLRDLKSGQHRVLIFTQMTKMLDVLEAFLNFHGHRYLRLDGTTRVEQRQYLMDRFNADPRIFCFILSTRSGGVGVNLTGADTVIFYDSDWNPTMDAQAQDRCHRIGQTRDVHIYRLVSEMTVEENILKKANQKRLLGDLAIEGGNFTTAFFKEQTINDLFAEPSGLDSLVKEREKEKAEKEKELAEKERKAEEEKKEKEKEDSKKESVVLSQYEQALCKAEDETDAQAAKQLQAEQKAELAEFDENIPWDEREAELRKEQEEEISKVEMELAMLDKELTPIERYAVTVVEAQTEPETAEELKMAEEDIENSKKDWELARLKALKEEEERRAELEEDEMLYIYSKDESQVKKKSGKSGRKSSGKGSTAASSAADDSDADDSIFGSPGSVGGNRRASERLSPGSPGKKPAPKKSGTGLKESVVNETLKKVKAAATALNKKPKNGPTKTPAKKENGQSKATPKAKAGAAQVKTPNVKKPKGDGNNKVVQNGEKPSANAVNGDKKAKTLKTPKSVKTPTSTPVQNGHSNAFISNSKLMTQAKNALLKQQAQKAAHLQLNATSRVILSTLPPRSLPQSMLSPPQTSKLQAKPTTPKTPPTPVDPNVPPPWSNPNLVIRTRKAAVHSPVVLGQARQPRIPTPTGPPVRAPPSVLQQSLNRPPIFISSNMGVTTTTAAVSKATVSGAPTLVSLSGVRQTQQQAVAQPVGNAADRNIFQLFTPGSTRQASPGVVGVSQLRGATLINPANLQGARFITTGVSGQPQIVVTGGAQRPVSVAQGLTLIPAPGQAAAGTTRSVLTPNAGARLTQPITLQGFGGSLPMALNLIRTSSGNLTLPVQQGQQPGYVLITPRFATSTNQQGTPNLVSLVQTSQSSVAAGGQRLQLLAQVRPGGAPATQARLVSPVKQDAVVVSGVSPIKRTVPNMVPFKQVVSLIPPRATGVVNQVRPGIVNLSNLRPGQSIITPNAGTIRPTVNISPVKQNIVGLQGVINASINQPILIPNQTSLVQRTATVVTPTVTLVQAKPPTPTPAPKKPD